VPLNTTIGSASVSAFRSRGTLVSGNYESIQTITVGSEGASQVSFSSIPQTYQHLQVRAVLQQYNASTAGNIYSLVRLNGDATAGNYPSHNLGGSGSSAYSANIIGTSYSYGYISDTYNSPSATNIFATFVLDLVDYTSTAKNKEMMSIGGHEPNGSGVITLWSSMWLSTAAVNSITFYPNVPVSGNLKFKQHSTFALYGISAP